MSKFSTLFFVFCQLVIIRLSAQNLWQPYRTTERTDKQHIELSGEGWTLGHTDQPITNLSQLAKLKDVFATTVPNSVHWAYHKAGKLPHPYYHKNSLQYNFMDEKVWYYRRSFKMPTKKTDDFVFLCFDGVDYFSKVWVNDSLVGVHEGMFGGPTVEISRFLKPENEIVVEVRAGNWGNKATEYENLPRISSGDRDFSQRTGYNPRASGKIIKPWVISGGSGGEAFFSVGMWQGVRLEVVPKTHLERPYMTTKTIQPTSATLHLSCEILAHTSSLQFSLHPWKNQQLNHPNERGRVFVPITEKYSLLVEIRPKKAISGSITKEFPLELHQGRNWLEQDLVINNPRLWQPNGLGEAHLYDVKISLKKAGQIIDKITFDYGIRSIERVATAGPRTFDRWENWQFIINGKKIFVKGMNFTPQDILLDLPYERYRWTLEAAKKMGVQLIRIWGGGLLESDHFYHICNELGIMVWQDFPIGNQDTPDFPQDVWEAQVVQNIFRLRNHPSLAVWCGGNEFNPYSYGNAASIGILERNLDIFDKSRLFVRTTPDDGSMHAYPDMDPCWYNRSYRYEAWVSETGMHSMPEASLFYETVDNKEFFDLGKMWDKDFYKTHPEFIHHFTEYGPSRVPRMLSRASHIADMTNPPLETITEATQIGAGEFYQIFSEKIQGNYPTTAGLMPWVFKRHWPVIAIQLMDWFGHAAAPYYFLKRTYEPTHIALDLPRLLWKAGEKMPMSVKIMNASPTKIAGKITLIVFDDTFKEIQKQEQIITIANGTSVSESKMKEFNIEDDYQDRFLFVVVELKDATGKLISRSFYYPRVLARMNDKAFYEKYVNEPINWITLEKGPYLKATVANTAAKLEGYFVSSQEISGQRSQWKVLVKNSGKTPAFMTKIEIAGAKRAFVADDNFFWLAAGESREVSLDILWREPSNKHNAILEFSAWNAPKVTITPKLE
ncbi:MAG: glycosyl hydrolase 2 galactose-binding domain-containing protein [Runella sp.]